MILTLTNNGKGLIYGDDPARIQSERCGTLNIGAVSLEITQHDNLVPILFSGTTGRYKAKFTADDGTVYSLGNVTVRNGRIAAPSKSAKDFLALACRVEALEHKMLEQEAEIEALRHIFDTDALNFLIK